MNTTLARPSSGPAFSGGALDVPIFDSNRGEWYTGQSPPAIKRGANLTGADQTLSVVGGYRYLILPGTLVRDFSITLSSAGAIVADRPYTIWIECYDDTPFEISFVDGVSGSTIDTVNAGEGEFAYGFTFLVNWGNGSFMDLEPLPAAP